MHPGHTQREFLTGPAGYLMLATGSTFFSMVCFLAALNQESSVFLKAAVILFWVSESALGVWS